MSCFVGQPVNLRQVWARFEMVSAYFQDSELGLRGDFIDRRKVWIRTEYKRFYHFPSVSNYILLSYFIQQKIRYQCIPYRPYYKYPSICWVNSLIHNSTTFKPWTDQWWLTYPFLSTETLVIVDNIFLQAVLFIRNIDIYSPEVTGNKYLHSFEFLKPC